MQVRVAGDSGLLLLGSGLNAPRDSNNRLNERQFRSMVNKFEDWTPQRVEVSVQAGRQKVYQEVRVTAPADAPECGDYPVRDEDRYRCYFTRERTPAAFGAVNSPLVAELPGRLLQDRGEYELVFAEEFTGTYTAWDQDTYADDCDRGLAALDEQQWNYKRKRCPPPAATERGDPCEYLEGGHLHIAVTTHCGGGVSTVVKHFEQVGAGNALERAYLCGYLVLTVIKVWETCVRHLLSLPDDAVLDPHHPNFDARFTNYSETLKQLAIGRNEDDSSLPGLLLVHNAISMIDMATTPEVLEKLVRESQKKGGVSALALGQLGRDAGKWQLPPPDVWNETVAELVVDGSEYEQVLARWFVLHLGPGFELIYYRTLLHGHRNPEKERLFRDAVFSLQPLYRAYLPRLKERFREESARDALEEYLHGIAGTLGFKAALDYGDSLELDPMDPGFGSRLDSTDE